MVDDIKNQLDVIEGDTPSLNKLDKKMSLLLYHVFDNAEKLNEHSRDITCIKEDIQKAKSTIGAIKWVSGLVASVVTVVIGWLGAHSK